MTDTITHQTTTVVDYEVRYGDGSEPDVFETEASALNWQDWRWRSGKDVGTLWRRPVTTTVVYGEWEQVSSRNEVAKP